MQNQPRGDWIRLKRFQLEIKRQLIQPHNYLTPASHAYLQKTRAAATPSPDPSGQLHLEIGSRISELVISARWQNQPSSHYRRNFGKTNENQNNYGGRQFLSPRLIIPPWLGFRFNDSCCLKKLQGPWFFCWKSVKKMFWVRTFSLDLVLSQPTVTYYFNVSLVRAQKESCTQGDLPKTSYIRAVLIFINILPHKSM